MKTFLGIDCGTQSTKVIIYDPAKKKVLARGQAPHALISDSSGRREQKAEWWIVALKKAMAKIPKKLRLTVVAVGVSGQQHGFVPLGQNGEVLYPAKLWCDTTTTAECAEITARYGGASKLLSNVGNLMLPGYTAPKILWLKNHEPKIYAKLATVLLPHDYLNFWMTGEKTMEYGDASGTGLLDIRTRQWATDLIGALDPQRDLLSCLPNLIESHVPAGRLTEKASKALGLNPGILVSSGGGDNMMGAIGTGTHTDGSLTMSLGTSGTLYGFSPKPIIDPDGNLAAFCSSTGGWLPLLCTMNCTVATELTRSLFDADLVQKEKWAAEARAGAGGVITLPFFNGERTPNLPNGRGCIVGLTPVNYTPANLMRSAMESAIFGLKLGLESFEKLGFKAREIKLIGGGAKSVIWRQMAADIFELPVVCPIEEEAAALGGALQALWCWECQNGGQSDLNAILSRHVSMDRKKRHTPTSSGVALYKKVYQNYKQYLDVVSPLYK